MGEAWMNVGFNSAHTVTVRTQTYAYLAANIAAIIKSHTTLILFCKSIHIALKLCWHE